MGFYKLKRHRRSLRSFNRTTIALLVIIILVILSVRVFFISIYKVTSSSMYPTIKRGDRIIIWKMSYGPRVLNLWKLIVNKDLDFHWCRGFSSPKRNDVFVFNWPNYKSLKSNSANLYGTLLVKRCAAVAGDTVLFKNEGTNQVMKKVDMDISFISNDLFPHDSTLDWTLNNYGPIIVPGEGMTIKLTSAIVKQYQDVLHYEGNETSVRNDSVFLNGMKFDQYCFKEDYYFMIGDNFHNSIDSRYWGFVPQKNILGKVGMILFSLDPDLPWYRRFRWNRVLMRV